MISSHDRAIAVTGLSFQHRWFTEAGWFLGFFAVACSCAASPPSERQRGGEKNPEAVAVGRVFEFANYRIGGKQTPAGVDNPCVAGAAVWVKWCDIEKKMGDYDWGVIDRLAHPWITANKKVVLRVDTSPCGRRPSIPQWLRDAGACAVTHPETREVFPVYWDPVFLDNWSRFVWEFGERYDKNSNVEFVQVAGIGWFGEMLLPRQAAAGRFTSLQDKWIEAGYTRAVYTKTCKRVLDTYRAAFPNTPVALMLSHPMDDSEIMTEIVEYAIGSYGSRVYLQNNSLGAINGLTEKADLAGWPHWANGYAGIYSKHREETRVVLEMIYSMTSGKSPWGRTGSLSEAVDVAIEHKADYLFVWKEDIANLSPDVQRTLNYAASRIGAPQTVPLPTD